MEQLIARWTSKSGKHWAKLYECHTPDVPLADIDAIMAARGCSRDVARVHAGQTTSYHYSGPGCGGSLGVLNFEAAIRQMQARVDSGYFLPDSAKTPMTYDPVFLRG